MIYISKLVAKKKAAIALRSIILALSCILLQPWVLHAGEAETLNISEIVSENHGDNQSNRQTAHFNSVPTYTVQVGVYSSQANADDTAAQLNRKGIDCSIHSAGKFLKVLCGSPQKEKYASTLRIKLSRLGYKDAYIVQSSLSTPPVSLNDSEAASVLKDPPGDTAKEAAEEISTASEEDGDFKLEGSPPESSDSEIGADDEPSMTVAAEVGEKDSDIEVRTDKSAPISNSQARSGSTEIEPSVKNGISEKPAGTAGPSAHPASTHDEKNSYNPVPEEAMPGTNDPSLPHSDNAKKNVIVISSIIAGAAILLSLFVLVLLRRSGVVQSLRARKIVDSYKDLFRNISRSSDSVANVAKKLTRIGNVVLIEQVLDRAAESSDSKESFRELYDATGITDKYIHTLNTSKSWKKRAFACEKLGTIGSIRAVPLLLTIIRDINNEDEDVRSVALRALGRIKDKRAIPDLIEALGFPETWLPPRIAEIIVQIGGEAVDYLKLELKNFQSESRRGWSAEILGWLDAKSAVASLIESLLDASPEVRAKAAGALGKIKDERAIVKLTELLISEPIPFVRTRVSQALGAIGNPSVIHCLVSMLKDPEWWVRVRAVEALEQLGEESIPSLLVALEDEDLEVRKRAALALEKIGYVDRILLEYGEDTYKPELKKILFLIAQSGVIESLAERLGSSNIHIQKRIVRLLGDAKTREAEESLVELLKKTSDWTLKARIIESLGKIGARDAVGLLIENLKDSEYWIRRSAVEALGHLEIKECSDDIAKILDDPSPLARESALRALSMLKVTTHWDKIERLLLDPATAVRSAALSVMRELGITTDRDKILSTLNESSEDVRIEAIKYFSEITDVEVLEQILKLLPRAGDNLRQEIVGYVRRIKPGSFQSIIDLFNIKDLSINTLATLIEIASVVRDSAAHQFILDFTGSVDEQLRESAFRAIASFGFAEHEAMFEKALFDPARSVRTIVLACVGSDMDETFLEKAKVLANDPDEHVRLALALAIGASGFTAFKPLIISMLDDPSLKVVAGAFISLASFHDKAFIKFFYSKKNINDIRKEVIKLTEDKRFTSIIDGMKAKSNQSRNLEVGLLLAKNERAFAYDMIKKLKESLDPVIRIKAIEMLKIIAMPELFTSVLSVMNKDPYAEVRIEAMAVVSAIGRDEEVITALSTTLADPAPDVRNRAAEMLGKYKNTRALEALLHVLDTNDRTFREAVTTSLSELLTGEPDKVAELVRSVPETKTRKIGMAWLMGKSRKKGSVKFLTNLIRDNDPEVRAAAVGALGKFMKKQFNNILGKLIYDPNERVRAAAINALAAAGGERTYELIQESLQDIDSFVRMRTVISLAKLDIKKTVRVIKAKAAKFPEYNSYLNGLLYATGDYRGSSEKLDTVAINIVDELCSRDEMLNIFKQSSDIEKRLHAFRVLSLANADSNQELLDAARKDPVLEIRREAEKHKVHSG